MAKVVRRVDGGPGANFVVLETDSTGTAVLVVAASAYVPGRPTDEYDPADLVQLDLDTLEEVHDEP